VRGSRLPRWSSKGYASGTEVLSVSLSTCLKIQSCLYRGASESLESPSTWIRGDRQIIETGKIHCLIVPYLLSCNSL
jgi:hypothetical protein